MASRSAGGHHLYGLRSGSVALREFVPRGWHGHRGERVDDAISIEPVDVEVALTERVELGRPAFVGVGEQPRFGAGVLGCATEQQALDLVWGQPEARVGRVMLTESADDQGGDAYRVRRGHRRALEVLVVAAY